MHELFFKDEAAIYDVPTAYLKSDSFGPNEPAQFAKYRAVFKGYLTSILYLYFGKYVQYNAGL